MLMMGGGDQKVEDPQTTAFLSLPPGCRFYPSEEQLLCYYLAGKNCVRRGTDSSGGFDVIQTVDLYDYEPFDLPDTTSFSYGYLGRRRHWYCYMSRVCRKGNRRRAGSGFWKRKGGIRDVMGRGGKVVLGKRKSFVFYLGNSQNAHSRTDWVMHEYALADPSKASFVLCRIFIKSRNLNNTSEHGLSSCAEGSMSTVKHIGIQHDGSIAPGNEARVLYGDFVDVQDEIQRIHGEPNILSNQVTAGPLPGDSFQYSLSIPPDIPLQSDGHAHGEDGFVDGIPSQKLLSLLQEDFIELDDLVCQLPGVD